MADEGSTTTAAPPAPSSGVSEQAQRFRDATEQIRQRTELTAKALGGLGTTAVSAIGIAKFADIFPWAPGQGWWVGLLVTSFLVMIAAVGIFTYRLWHVSERIILRSDVERMTTELDSDEQETVRQVYDETARLNRAPSLRVLEARAQRLYRIADRMPDETAKKLTDQADDLVSSIRAVEARAGMIVVRRRAAQAIRGRGAIVTFIALAAAIIVFGISADRLDSERTQLTKIVKDCADAKKAAEVGGIRSLPRICRSGDTSNPHPPSHSSTGPTGPTGPTGARGATGPTGATGRTKSTTAAPAKGTPQRVLAMSGALRVAAGLAQALGAYATAQEIGAKEGTKILNDFLHQVGYPLAKEGIRSLAKALWKRYARPHPPPLPVQAGGLQQLTVVLRDTRPPIQFFNVSSPPTLFTNLVPPQERFRTIKLTVVVRDRRPHVQIIRVPDDG